MDSYAILVALLVILVVAFLFRGYLKTLVCGIDKFETATATLPLDQDFGPGQAKETHGGWMHHLHADPSLEWWSEDGQLTRKRSKERYGEPPGAIRAVHQDELGFRGWADMPGDYEGSSASAVSAYIQRSA